MIGRARGALLWRLYAIGIVQLALVVAGAIAIGMVVARLPRFVDPLALSVRLGLLVGEPAQLRRTLDELRGQHIEVSLYHGDRTLIASNVQPPLPAPQWGPEQDSRASLPPPPPLPPPDATHFLPGFWPHPHGPRTGHHLHMPGMPRDEPPHMAIAYLRLALPGRDGILVAHFEPPRPSLLPVLLSLGFGLVVIFAGALLTARWIGRPLERLTRAARALGRGDLRARTEIERGDELGELARAFDDMAARMEQLLLAEKELLANVAHELRTPLARIRVALEIAAEGDAEVTRASLAEIAVDLAELEALINDVLTAARFEIADGQAPAAGFALHRERIGARAIAERAVERFRAHHPERTLVLDCADDAPEIDADPVLFRRVLDNLLENAHKYTPDASLPIRVRVLTAADRAHAAFEVVDQGSGIAEDDLPRVFGAFFRGERSRSRGTGGVGLGLTLAKRIVEAHGGTIRIASSLGAGTSAHVSLPAAK